jgi:hypothetical protein
MTVDNTVHNTIGGGPRCEMDERDHQLTSRSQLLPLIHIKRRLQLYTKL